MLGGKWRKGGSSCVPLYSALLSVQLQKTGSHDSRRQTCLTPLFSGTSLCISLWRLHCTGFLLQEQLNLHWHQVPLLSCQSGISWFQTGAFFTALALAQSKTPGTILTWGQFNGQTFSADSLMVFTQPHVQSHTSVNMLKSQTLEAIPFWTNENTAHN